MQTEAVLAGLPLERAAKEGVFFGEKRGTSRGTWAQRIPCKEDRINC